MKKYYLEGIVFTSLVAVLLRFVISLLFGSLLEDTLLAYVLTAIYGAGVGFIIVIFYLQVMTKFMSRRLLLLSIAFLLAMLSYGVYHLLNGNLYYVFGLEGFILGGAVEVTSIIIVHFLYKRMVDYEEDLSKFKKKVRGNDI